MGLNRLHLRWCVRHPPSFGTNAEKKAGGVTIHRLIRLIQGAAVLASHSSSQVTWMLAPGSQTCMRARCSRGRCCARWSCVASRSAARSAVRTSGSLHRPRRACRSAAHWVTSTSGFKRRRCRPCRSANVKPALHHLYFPLYFLVKHFSMETVCTISRKKRTGDIGYFLIVARGRQFGKDLSDFERLILQLWEQ